MSGEIINRVEKYLKNDFNEDLVDLVMNSKKYSRVYNGSIKNVDFNKCKKLYEDYNLPIYKIAMLYGISDGTIRNY